MDDKESKMSTPIRFEKYLTSKKTGDDGIELIKKVLIEFDKNGHILKETIAEIKRFPNDKEEIIYKKEIKQPYKKDRDKTLSWIGKISGFMKISNILNIIARSITASQNIFSIDSSTIIGLMVIKKAKKNINSYLILLGILLIQIITAFIGIMLFSYLAFGLTLFFILLIFINQKALEYRIIHGFYGSNTYETREIIQFITQHTDKTDFTDGDGFKKLLQEPLKSEEHESDYVGVPQT